MARDQMPPQVVSSGRFGDIQPYCDRLRASDPMLWGSVFPWEFPQNGTRQQEEDFLRKWFSPDEIHVQGGAGDEKTGGAGFRFLKQVWYTQALWNFEQRVPAVNSWWWKTAEDEGLINIEFMQRYVLDPNVQLKTFFQSRELAMYGEKFLWQVIPLIQHTARVKISEKGSSATTASNAKVDLREQTKTASQPPVITSSVVSSAGSQRVVSNSAAPVYGTHYPVTNHHQASVEPPPPPFTRNRGSNGGARFRERGRGGHPHMGHHAHHAHHAHTVQPGLPYDQVVDPATHGGYGVGPGMQNGYARPSQLAGPTAHRDISQFHVPRALGFPGAHGPHPDFRFPDTTGLPLQLQFSAPHYPGQQPIYMPLADRSNHGDRRGSRGTFSNGTPQFRSGVRIDGDDKDFGMFSNNDRGRGRGKRGRGSSFGSHPRPPQAEFLRYTSYEFDGQEIAAKECRGSVISDERSWRSGSEHPQKDISAGENTSLSRPKSRYVPPKGVESFDPKPAHFSKVTTTPPRSSENCAPEARPPPAAAVADDPRYHCRQHSIGDLCTYAIKLTVFSIPPQVDQGFIKHFFSRFGQVVDVFMQQKQGPGRSYARVDPSADRYAFVTFSNADEARNCYRNKPSTWLPDSRPLCVEVPKEYWDPHHYKFLANRSLSTTSRSALESNVHRTDYQRQGTSTSHQHHDSASTVRASPGDAPSATELQGRSGASTPTASGTSTPKKKGQSSRQKNKGKAKLANDLRVTSITDTNDTKDESQTKSEDLQGRSPAQAPLASPVADDDVIQEKLELVADLDKQRNESTTTDLQAASELSITPVDKVTMKLPKSQVSQDHEGTAPSTVSDAKPKHKITQASHEPSLTVADSAHANDTAESSRAFRNHEAKAETPTATAVSGTVNQRAKTTGPSIGSKDFSTKAEHEPVDDSLHTATASPSSNKDAAELTNSNTTPTKHPAEPAENIDHSVQATRAVQSAYSTQNVARDQQAVEVPSSTAPLRIDTELAIKMQGHQSNRSTPEGNGLKPNAAFVTAPNTSTVEQDVKKEVSTEESAESKCKTAEKAKGPSQTESFSVFGGKSKKKAKPEKKKSTLKGKPKDLATATAAPSGANAQKNGDAKSEKDIQTEVSATSSKKKQAAERGQSGDVDKLTQRSSNRGQPANIQTDQVDDSTSQKSLTTGDGQGGNDKKPAGFFGAVKNFLGGHDGKGTPNKTQTEGTSVVDPSLTDTKALETGVGDETMQFGASTDGSDVGSPADGGSRFTFSFLEDSFQGKNNAASGSAITADHRATDQAKVKPNTKKKKKPRKSSKNAGDNIEDVPPELEDADVNLTSGDTSVFTFKAGNDSPLRSTHSDTSSNTVGAATPSTGTPSPVLAKPPRGLILPTPRSASVVREKEPSWKYKKRTYRAVAEREESGDEDMKSETRSETKSDTTSNYALENIDSKNSATSDGNQSFSVQNVIDQSTGMQTPRTILQLLPRDTRTLIIVNVGSDDRRAGESITTSTSTPTPTSTSKIEEVNDSVDYGPDSQEVRESKAKMQRLLEQESSRKHSRQSSRAGAVVRVAEREKSRIEELGESYPGSMIVSLTPVDESDD